MKQRIPIILCLFSLVTLGYNILSLNSIILGVIVAPIYLFTISLLCGNVFFSKQNLWFKVFYGFIIFYCLIAILGIITYWIYNLSNWPVLAVLITLTMVFIALNWRKAPEVSISISRIKEKIAGLNLGVLDIAFLVFASLCFYFLFEARTGESILPIWSTVSSNFFITFILAIATLLIKIRHGKSPSGLLLFYTIIIIIIPATVFLIVMRQPYFTMKGATPLEWTRIVSETGTFSPDPDLPEATHSLFGKATIQIGQIIANAFMVKLLQVSPLKFGLYFGPILFTLMTVLSTYSLIKSLASGRKGLAIFCSLAFLATQHSIFLFTPPGKEETFALGLLMVNFMLLMMFLRNHHCRLATFFSAVIITVGILSIHQWVGLFAAFLAALALTNYWLKPFKGKLSRTWLWLGTSTGLILIWTFGYPYIQRFASYVIGSSAGGNVNTTQFDLSNIAGTIRQSWWSGEGLGIWQFIFYTFINNSIYIAGILIIIGIIASYKMRLAIEWLGIYIFLLVCIIIYAIYIGSIHSPAENYRFFYYGIYIAFPLMGVGLYWLSNYITERKVWLRMVPKWKGIQRTLKPLQLATYGLLLASLFASSVYAGYPREDSMGYNHNRNILYYISDHDAAAMNFIKAREEDPVDFFIVADAQTSAMGVLTLGKQVITAEGKYPSIFSFFHSTWGSNSQFRLAWEDPIRYLVESTGYANSFADTTYLVFTYRLGMTKLNSIVDIYSEYLGEPVFSVKDKLYMFSYNEQTISDLLAEATSNSEVLFDDEPVADFWQLLLFSGGNLDFSISNNATNNQSGNNCMQVTISTGEYSRVSLSHKWDEPLDFGEASYLLLWAYGTDSGQSFNIVFRSIEPSVDNVFVYSIKDNFEGWKLLDIPLESFDAIGSPSWHVVQEILVQFKAGWPLGETYFDSISLFQRVPIQFLLDESVILLP